MTPEELSQLSQGTIWELSLIAGGSISMLGRFVMDHHEALEPQSFSLVGKRRPAKSAYQIPLCGRQEAKSRHDANPRSKGKRELCVKEAV